ncbi:zinc ribbon domain-containing protein [Candidatus Bathyarchaeota archaeon]|nr:zinc ribbon domain-containing protein [Candidatus Bathyarchaeota archaeon]
MPYCSNCGNKVLDTDKFCNNCGAQVRPVNPPPSMRNTPPPPPPTSTPNRNPPPPPPPSTMNRTPPPPPAYAQPQSYGETIVTTVSNFQKPKSFGRFDAYIILATAQNLLLIQLTNDMVNRSIKEAQEKAKAEGKGFWGQWGAQLGTSFDYAAKYAGWTKEQVLAEIPDAQIIPNQTVSKIELTSSVNSADYGKAVQRNDYKLKIYTAGGKLELESGTLDTKIKVFHSLFPGRFQTNVHF